MMGRRRRGRSYEMRVAAVNELYDKFSRTGLSNREIWRRYIYPRFGIDESTMYRMLKAAGREELLDQRSMAAEGFLFPEFEEEERGLEFFRTTGG